jgi:transcription termination factor Rho
LIPEDDLQRIWLLRKAVHDLNSAEAMELLIDKIGKYKTNKEFLENMNKP